MLWLQNGTEKLKKVIDFRLFKITKKEGKEGRAWMVC